MADLDYTTIGLQLTGALATFLLGLELLSEALEARGVARVKPMLARFSRTPLLGILTGALATAVLDSSSAVIVLLIALVQARVLAFRNALGIVLGANIGTTVGSQIIALDLTAWAPILLMVGVAGRLAFKQEALRTTAEVLTGLGLVFWGLGLMDLAVHPLRDSEQVLDALATFEDPVQGALAGGLATLIIQSSSATVGIAIGLAKSGILTLPAGVAIMLGAEIGTCADTLVATIGRSREAIRVGIFHLVFNILSVIGGLMMVEPLTEAAILISPEAGPGRQIANAHVMFNVAGALLAVGFVPWAADRLERWIPDRATGEPDPLVAADDG